MHVMGLWEWAPSMETVLWHVPANQRIHCRINFTNIKDDLASKCQPVSVVGRPEASSVIQSS